MVGLFIGSFNPPTKAHLEICQMLKNRFQKIVFVPVNTKEKELVSFKDRKMMLSFYTRRYQFLEISDIMNNYSYFDFRILNLLKEKYQDVRIIMGSDILKNFLKFDGLNYLLENYFFEIIIRDDFNAQKFVLQEFPNYQDKFFFHKYSKAISSSICRSLIKNKQDTKGFLDDEITSYIKEHDLYF